MSENRGSNKSKEKEEIRENDSLKKSNKHISNVDNIKYYYSKGKELENNKKPQKLTKSKPNMSCSVKKYISENAMDTLFSKEELGSLEKILSPEDIERFSKKYETLLKSKQSIEKQNKLELKKISYVGIESGERLDFLNQRLNENEQKVKLLIHQLNDQKNENRILNKKVSELNNHYETTRNSLIEKEQENKVLSQQLQQLRKVTKSNILSPIDSDVLKKIEGIKNEKITTETISTSNKVNIPQIDTGKFGVDFDVFNYSNEVGKQNLLKSMFCSAFSYKDIISLLNLDSINNYLDELRIGYSYDSAFYHNVSN